MSTEIPSDYGPVVQELIAQGKKVVDLSADFRFQDAAVYEAAYQPHSARELLKESVYGLSEVYTDRIKAADLIGNPGCYPTSVLLPLLPFPLPPHPEVPQESYPRVNSSAEFKQEVASNAQPTATEQKKT